VLKTIGAIGDIHNEHVALQRVLEFLAGNVDAVLSVGDIVDGPGDANVCCELLRNHGAFVVGGNHERWLLADEMRVLSHADNKMHLQAEHVSWLKQLPKTLEFDTIDGKLMLCHGLGPNDMAMLRPEDSGYAIESNTALEKILYESNVRYVINGHTHQRMVRKIDEITFVNAGTLARFQFPCFCILDLSARQVQFFDLTNDNIIAHAPTELP